MFCGLIGINLNNPKGKAPAGVLFKCDLSLQYSCLLFFLLEVPFLPCPSSLLTALKVNMAFKLHNKDWEFLVFHMTEKLSQGHINLGTETMPITVFSDLPLATFFSLIPTHWSLRLIWPLVYYYSIHFPFSQLLKSPAEGLTSNILMCDTLHFQSSCLMYILKKYMGNG